MIRRTLLFVPALVAGISLAAAQTPKTAPVEIVGAEFGIFDESKSGELVFEPAKTVPRKLGQRYGWIIEVRTAKRTLAVREEYLLPLPPKAREAADTPGESQRTLLQRRSQVSQRQLVPVGGKIYGEWSVGPNEPAGHRHLQVVIEDGPGADFEYDVK